MIKTCLKAVFSTVLIFASTLHAQTVQQTRFFDGIQFAVPYLQNQWLVVTDEGTYVSTKNDPTHWRCACGFENTTYPHFAGGGRERVYWIQAVLPTLPHQLMYFENDRVVFVREVPSYAGSFATAQTGCFGNGGGIVTTTDAGKTWNPEVTVFAQDEVVKTITWLSPTDLVANGSKRHLAYCEMNEKGLITIKWRKFFGEVLKDISPVDNQSFIALGEGHLYKMNKSGDEPQELKFEPGRRSPDDIAYQSNFIFAWRFKNLLGGVPGEILQIPISNSITGKHASIVFDKLVKSVQMTEQSEILLFAQDGFLFKLDFASKSAKEVALNINQDVMNATLEARRNRSNGIQPSENEVHALVVAVNKAGIEAEREIMEKSELLKLRSTMTPRQYTLWLTAEFNSRISQAEKKK